MLDLLMCEHPSKVIEAETRNALEFMVQGLLKRHAHCMAIVLGNVPPEVSFVTDSRTFRNRKCVRDRSTYGQT